MGGREAGQGCPVDDQLKTETPAASPPGWDADPYGRHELRYWDGDGWTEHVSDHGETAVDAPQTASPWAAMTQPAPTPRGSSWSPRTNPSSPYPPRGGRR